MLKREHLPFFLLLAAFLLVAPVRAEDGVSLTDFPSKLAEQFGTSLFAGQLLASAIIVCLFIFPTLLLTRNQSAPLIVGFLAMSLCIGLGYLPVYVLAILTLIVAVMFGDKIVKRF